MDDLNDNMDCDQVLVCCSIQLAGWYVVQLAEVPTDAECDEHTQFSTEEADSVVLAVAILLVLVEAHKAVVLVIPVDHFSCLVGRNAIKGFSLDIGRTKKMTSNGSADFREECLVWVSS